MKNSNEQCRTCTRGHRFTGSEPCPVCWPGYRTFTFQTKVWLYSSETSAWHFVSVPQTDSAIIKERFTGLTRGWGSLPVTVTIGHTSWQTSIFPDAKTGTYLLPVKADVRRNEKLHAGDTVDCHIVVRI